MEAVTDSDVINQQYCIRILPNKIRTYGSAQDYFKHSDDTLGNFGNCLVENDNGATPPVTQNYPSYVSIDSSGVITLNDPTTPANPSISETFTFYFSCEDQNSLGLRVRNHVDFTINHPSAISSSISQISSPSWRTEYFTIVDGVTPYISIQDFYDSITDVDKHCGYRFILSQSSADTTSWNAPSFNETVFEINNQ